MTPKQIRDLKWSHLQRTTISSNEAYLYGENIPTKEEDNKRHVDFLTYLQKQELLYLEELKKERQWREDHWVETEGGDGYYDARKQD